MESPQGKLRAYHTSPERIPPDGYPIAAFCRREGVSSASFYFWKRRLAVEPTPTFVPITVADTPTAPPVEVAFPNGIVLRLPADAQSLRTLFALAREASC